MNVKTTIPDRLKSTKLAWAGRAALFFGAFVVVTLVLVAERGPALSGNEYMIGEPSPRTLFSPFKINYVDEKTTEGLRQQKRQNISPIFKVNPSAEKEMTAKIDQFFRAPKAVKPPFEVSPATLEFLSHQPALEETRKNVELLLGQIRQGVLDPAKKAEAVQAGTHLVTVVFPDQSEKTLPLNEISTLEDAKSTAPRLLPEAVAKNKNLKSAVLDIFARVAVPSLAFDEEETEKRRKRASEEIEPVQEEIKKEELIVQRGMRITEQ